MKACGGLIMAEQLVLAIKAWRPEIRDLRLSATLNFEDGCVLQLLDERDGWILFNLAKD